MVSERNITLQHDLERQHGHHAQWARVRVVTRRGLRIRAGAMRPCSLILALALLVTGCASSAVHAPTPPPATATAPPVALTPTVNPTALNLHAAWGNVHVRSIATLMPHNYVFVSD